MNERRNTNTTPIGLFGKMGTTGEIGALVPPRPNKAHKRTKAGRTLSPDMFGGNSLIPPTRATRFRNWRIATLTTIGTKATHVRKAIVAWYTSVSPSARKWRAFGILFFIVLVAVFGLSMSRFLHPMQQAQNMASRPAAAKTTVEQAAAVTVTPVEEPDGTMTFQLAMPTGIDLTKAPKRLKDDGSKMCRPGQTGWKMVRGSMIICGDDLLMFKNGDVVDGPETGGK